VRPRRGHASPRAARSAGTSPGNPAVDGDGFGQHEAIASFGILDSQQKRGATARQPHGLFDGEEEISLKRLLHAPGRVERRRKEDPQAVGSRRGFSASRGGTAGQTREPAHRSCRLGRRNSQRRFEQCIEEKLDAAADISQAHLVCRDRR
jgi:hypothetical protein